MRHARGAGGGPSRKFGPTGCRGARRVLTYQKGWPIARTRAIGRCGHGHPRRFSKDDPRSSRSRPDRSTSELGRQDGGSSLDFHRGKHSRKCSPRCREGWRRSSPFSRTRSPGCCIPQTCRGFAGPGGRSPSRASGEKRTEALVPAGPARNTPGFLGAVQKYSMHPWPRGQRARGTTRWRIVSPMRVIS